MSYFETKNRLLLHFVIIIFHESGSYDRDDYGCSTKVHDRSALAYILSDIVCIAYFGFSRQLAWCDYGCSGEVHDGSVLER